MKCAACGYDDCSPEKDWFGDDILFIESETTLEIRIERDYSPDIFEYHTLYLCPKCGTLKIKR